MYIDWAIYCNGFSLYKYGFFRFTRHGGGFTAYTKSIPPLLLSIDVESLEAAKAIIIDLFTIAADRDQYYCDMAELYVRHKGIIRRLCADAPALLPTLLDGLIWRSRLTEKGQQCVNYYFKNLVVDQKGKFSKVLESVTEYRDPKAICHPILSLTTDLIWSRVAFRTFLSGKSWFILTLLIFMTSQSISQHTGGGHNYHGQNIAIFICLCFIWLCSLGSCLIFHVKHCIRDYRTKNVARIMNIPVSNYLTNWQHLFNLILTITLTLMLATEPILG